MTRTNGPAMSDDSTHFGSQARTHAPTIRELIVNLVAIVCIPLVGLCGWLAISYAAAQRQIIEVRRADAAGILTSYLDQEVSGIAGALTGLATSEDLSGGNFGDFQRQARAVATQPSFRAIYVLRASGAVVVSTEYPGGQVQAIQLSDTTLSRVFQGQTVVSDLASMGPSGSPEFYVSVPVWRAGTVAFALTAAVKPDRIKRVFAAAGMGKNWVAAIVDRNGRFAARSLSPDEYTGKLARPELVSAARGDVKSGQFENVTHEGMRSVNSFRRSPLTGWTSVVAVPKDELAAPLFRTVLLLAFGGIAASVSVLSLAYAMAARISGPVKNLSEAAVALVEGRLLPETQHRIAEFEEVRNAFDHAIVNTAQLAAVAAASSDAIMSVGLDGRVQSWNRGAEELLEYQAAEIIGQRKSKVVPSDKMEEYGALIDRVKSGESVRVETVRLKKNGARIDVSLTVAPLRRADGTVVAISSTAHDISERKRVEQQQRFVMRELTHRSKNLLAIVQSMATQTAKTASSLSDFTRRFSDRLQGLSSSHEVLVEQNWEGAPLAELIKGQMRLFVESDDCKLTVDGPDVVVDTTAAQAIGLALHELATNAIKYGALSVPTGRVAITWAWRTLETGQPHLELKWQERGGPDVTPPSRTGFGHFVIDRMAAQSTNGSVKIDYDKQGITWRLSIPVSSLVGATKPRDHQADDTVPAAHA